MGMINWCGRIDDMIDESDGWIGFHEKISNDTIQK